MSYARARLWLGIAGVGSLVMLSSIALILGWPSQFLSNQTSFGSSELFQLAVLTAAFMFWQLPFDFLGGYFLPARYQKSEQTLAIWFLEYSLAASIQALLFLTFGTLIVRLNQFFGPIGAAMVITLGIVACFITRNWRLSNKARRSDCPPEKLTDAISLNQSWQISIPQVLVVKHRDIGFTGGVIGLGDHARIVIPEAWLAFTRGKLATAIARRAIAINSGSYSRGLVFAFLWNLCGFLLCSFLPGAALSSVAGLVTTICGFTLWSFLGLLVLPSLSRNASLKIDNQLLQKGLSPELISSTAFTMDQLQDGEPDRAPWIEAIFHPVPNVTSRNSHGPIRGLGAWNVARTTLFFSWACLGFLSRSVHCNVGRPELWTMLPTD